MRKHVYQYDHPLLNNWLRGTVCHCYWVGRSVLCESEDYIILKHHSHTHYMGRFLPNRNCPSYASLYRKSDINLDLSGYNQNLYLGRCEISRWEGRVSKDKIIIDCRAMGIDFPEIYIMPTTPDDAINIQANHFLQNDRVISEDALLLMEKARNLTGF